MSDSSSRLRLRGKLLAALATGSMATMACGGSVSSEGTGGTGALGGTSSGGASTGGVGGFGATGGVSTGGTGGVSTGGTGGVSTGGVGGIGGVGGLGGFAGAGGDGPFYTGEVDCNACSPTFYTCWKSDMVPVYSGTPPSQGCPPSTSIDTSGVNPCSTGFGAYVQGDPIEENGLCCYLSGMMCPGGRPFKVDGELRVAAVARRPGWVAESAHDGRSLSAEERKALATVWIGDAQLEHASVAAFARLTLELMQLGAPSALVAASQNASVDEVRHARMCFGFASRFAGAQLGPEKLDLDGALGSVTLEKLARETVEEGCVGETLAALQAAEQRRMAQDPEIRAALSAIETEESEHAAFAYRVVRWAISVGGESVRRAARDAFEAALAQELSLSDPDVSVEVWHHYGRLTAAELREVRARGIEEVVRPCMAALFERREQPALSA